VRGRRTRGKEESEEYSAPPNSEGRDGETERRRGMVTRVEESREAGTGEGEEEDINSEPV